MAVRFEELWLALSDGYQAHGRFWYGEEVTGGVLYHHGIQSHCDWFNASAAALAEAGFAVLQMDRRGCGRNEAARGDADSAEQLLSDVRTARDELRGRSGFHKYHVVGVSWGGKLAAAAYADDPAGVSSLSLVTPGLFPRVGVSRDEMARIGFAMLYEPRQSFPIPLDSPELFTSHPFWQHYIETDEFTLRECTAGFYLASRRLDKIVAKLPELTPTPLHLFVAGDERIIDNEKTTSFIRGLGWPGVHISQYPQARHSLEFDAASSGYYRDLVAFIEAAARQP